MPQPQWAQRLPWEIIAQMSGLYGIEQQMIAAVIQAESMGNPYAMRAEVKKTMNELGVVVLISKWKWFLKPDDWASIFTLPTMSRATEWTGQLIAWGPMMVQGSVAREHGFAGWLPELCSWDLGLKYGCLHLRGYAQRFGTEPEKLYAAYNGGPGAVKNKTPGGMYSNQGNVDRFMQIYRELNP